MRAAPVHPALARLPGAGLVALYAFTAFALIGYATFGLHPALLVLFPQFARFYGIAFQFFAQAQIYIAFAVIAAVLALYAGARWVAAFVALYVLSLSSELLGTGAGIPFGEYHYTAALGPRWFGRVPVVIPLSWFFMAVPSYAAARAAFPARPLARVMMASLILLSWDLALDPAMSHATRYWVWGETGAYYGMPWLNLFGWYVTGLVLMAALALLRSDAWVAAVPLRWMLAFYGANLLLPVGMSAAAGLWGAVAATAAALGGAAVLARALGRRAEARTGMVGVPA